MATGLSEPTSPPAVGRLVRVSDAVYSIVFFFLAAGRFQFELGPTLEIKIGGSPENLVFFLLVARWIRSDLPLQRLRGTLAAYLPGVLLILLGLCLSALLNPTSRTFEDLLRMAGQFAVGTLLAEWLIGSQQRREVWYWAFLLGVLALFLRTPWSELDDPNLEGPFSHRNVQAAFGLLAVPLLFLPSLRRGFRLGAHSAACLTAVGAIAAFLLLSRTRSALIALIVVGAVAALLVHRTPRWSDHSRAKWVIRGAAAAALLLAIVALLPRFQQFGQELMDPYRRSRIPIWAAAVEGWRDPTVLLFGIGLEDSFDRILLDTPQGNLNYRYRKAHYPHGLYLQWVYWGGVTALLGWMVLGASTVKRLSAGALSPRTLLCGIFLIGYFFLEIFESAFREPRVAALFWLVLFLLHSRDGDSALETQTSSMVDWFKIPVLSETSSPWGKIVPAVVAAFLLLAVVFFSTFQVAASAGLLSALLLMLGWRETRISISNGILLFAAGGAFWGVLAFPFLAMAGESAVLGGGMLLAVVGVAITVVQSGLRQTNGSIWWFWAILAATLLTPLLLGAAPTLLLGLSPVHPPAELVPLEGWVTAAGAVFFWAVCCLSTYPPPGPAPRRRVLYGAVILMVIPLAAYRTFSLESTAMRLRANEGATVEEWWSLCGKAMGWNFPGQVDRVLLAALRSEAVKDSPEKWIVLARELSRDAESEIEDFPLALRLLARGGRVWESGEETDSAVGLEIDFDSRTVWVLTDSGRLFRIREDLHEKVVTPEVGPFVHLTLGFDREPVLLEAGGRLLSVREDRVEELLPSMYSPDVAYFLRLTVDPQRNLYWALDRFGVLYRSDLESRDWVRDDRFLPAAVTPDGEHPTAQDVAVSADGTLHFLNCFGEIWSSTSESTTLSGPDRGAHYFPDFPVAQSLSAEGGSLQIVDRYGGFYHSPYPTDRETLRLRNSHLFPRSLPRRDPEVVDSVYNSRQRSLHLLTKSGRILTNKKWESFWAR